MNPTVESSVIAFPRMEQRPVPPTITREDVEMATKMAAEEIRLMWLKSNATSSRICARTRLLHAAAASDLSDNAFRVLFLQLSYTNGTNLRTTVNNTTIAAVCRSTEKTVRRSNKELEAKGWMSSKRRRGGAEKVLAIPGDVLNKIGSEIMENFPPAVVQSASSEEWTKMSTLDVSPGYNAPQERTEMSALKKNDAAEEWTKMSTLDPMGAGSEADSEGKSGHFGPLRVDKNVRRIIWKEKLDKKNNKGAELDCIQSVREAIEEAQPPSVEDFSVHVVKVASVASAVLAGLAAASVPTAAAAIEPPAIVRQAPLTPECWDTPQARQNALLRPAEAKAQRELILTPDGCLEALGGFRAELDAKFPLVDLECGLLAAAPNIKPYMTAIESMATIRRQFAYMQADAKRKADRDAAFDKARSSPNVNSKRLEVLPGLFLDT